MSKDVDCQVFGDQLDALVGGDLPREGMRQLRLHASACPECAMLLRVQEHLALPSLEELESRVPEVLLTSLWARVEEAMGDRAEAVGMAEAHDTWAAGGSGDGLTTGESADGPAPRSSGENRTPGGRHGFRARFRWFVPTLAAATLLLLFSTGYLALERSRLRGREAFLEQQVAEQQRWLSELTVGADADPVARTAALAGRSPWLRALSRQESITVRGLRLLLERMPEDRIIMSQVQVDAALRSRTPLSMPLLRDVLVGIDSREGVRARDLLRALEGVGVGPDVAVPTADLMSLLS